MCSSNIISAGTCFLLDWNNLFSYLAVPLIMGVAGGFIFGVVNIFLNK